MKNQILNLITIKDYILEYYPKLLWWDGFHKHEIWNNQRGFKHRQGMPNEIRIEFDGKNINKNWGSINLTAINLWNAKYSFAIFYVNGGRSPHIHIYDIDELDNFKFERRNYYREKFLQKFCPKDSNPDLELCNEKHLCALEFVNHFKYKKPKQLLSLFWQGKNQGMDSEIFCEMVMGKEEKKIEKLLHKKRKKKFGDLIKETQRDLIISNLNFETIFKKYKIEYKGKMALCPFHADSNKSLSFSNEKGLWNCFGCNAKGDIITLIKLLEEVKQK